MVLTACKLGRIIVIRDRVIIGETLKQIAVPHHPDQ
jgi:hypothetical protein